MAVELGAGYVSLIASGSDLVESVAKELGLPLAKIARDSGEAAGKNLQGGLLSNATDTGKKLATALGLVALGTAAFKSATDVEDANNLIARSTGATGKALAGLETSFRNVASGSAASFDTISSTLAELNQRTGLTGKGLESLTSEVVSFNRTTKDAPITVQSLTSALAGFNVPAKETGTVLDHLFVISQKTGVPLASLIDTLNTAGPIARQFGFSAEFTAGLLAQLNKAGVDANSILPGLKKVFKDAAAAGKDPAQALRDIITQMDGLLKAGDRIGAQQLAVQVFGARGVGLVDAAVAGKLSLASLNQTIDVSGAGILDTAKKTGTLSGALGILKNNAKLALAEFATPAIEAANTALRSALPTVQQLGRDFASLPDPIKIGTVGVVGLASVLGPLGNAAQGIEGLGKAASGISTGFQLAAVRGLELVDSVRAIGTVTATTNTVGTLGGIGSSSIAAGLGLGALTLTASAFVVAGAAVAAASYGIVKALDLGTDGLDKNQLAGRRWAQSFVHNGGDVISTFRSIKTERDRLGDIFKEFGGAAGKAADIQAVITGAVDAFPNDPAKVKGIVSAAQAYQDLGTQLDKLGPAYKKSVAAQKETSGSLATYAASIARGGDATAAFAALTDTAKKAVTDFESTLLAGAGGEIGYQQSLLNIEQANNNVTKSTTDVETAQADLDKAIREHGPNSQEAAAAQQNLTDKQLAGRDAVLSLKSAQFQSAAAVAKLDEDTRNLIDSIHNGTISYDAQRAKLLEQIQLHPENAAGIQLEIDKLDAAKRAADLIPPDVTTTVHVDVDIQRFLSKLDALRPNLEKIGLSQGAIDLLTFADVPRTAVGGIFSTPQVRLFGEAGPEAVLPLSDPRRAFEILAQSGLFDHASVAMPAPSSPPAQPAGPLIGEAHFHAPTEDPVRLAFDTARSLRAAQFLAA